MRRPPAFYEHMLEGEQALASELSGAVKEFLGDYEGLRSYDMLGSSSLAEDLAVGQTLPVLTGSAGDIAGLTDPALLSQAALLPEDAYVDRERFPVGRLDHDLQQIDLRERNSRRLLLHEVSSVELLEVQLVNVVAPFVLNAKLKPLTSSTGAARIVAPIIAGADTGEHVWGRFLTKDYRPTDW